MQDNHPSRKTLSNLCLPLKGPISIQPTLLPSFDTCWPLWVNTHGPKRKQAKASSIYSRLCVCVCAGGARVGGEGLEVAKWCMMHGGSYRLLTQPCLVAFGERSLRPKGTYLIRVNHSDTLLTLRCHNNSSGAKKRALCDDTFCTLWRRYKAWMAQTDSHGQFLEQVQDATFRTKEAVHV